MFGRERAPLSPIEKFAHLHPFYSLIGAILGPAATLGLATEFAPLSLVSLLLVKALIKEFRHVKNPARKTISQFRESAFTIGKVKTGVITHYESQPVVEAYPIDSHLRALTKAHLLAPYLLEFHIQYLGYLFALINTAYGRWSLNPGKAAIQYINQEISRRGLNMEAIDADIYYMCREVTKVLKQHNQNSPFYLQISADDFDIDYFRALVAICDVAKGLGAEGCSTGAMSLEQNVKTLSRNLDWFNLFQTFSRYLVNIIEPTSHFRLHASKSSEDAKVDDERPEMTFSSSIPGIIPAITAFNNVMLVAVYNEVGAKRGNRQNGFDAWIGLVLAKKITEECSTMEEVIALLERHQPASTCNLIIVARDKHAVLQCMQYGSDKPFDMIDQDAYCVATNHAITADGKHMMRESAPIPDSKERYDKMTAEIASQQSALQKASLMRLTDAVRDGIFEQLRQIAVKPTTKGDTVQTILALLNYKENRYDIRMNTANFSSSFAPNEKGELQYDQLDLALIFKEFRKKVAEFHVNYNSSNSSEKKEITTQIRTADKPLIGLMQTAHQVSRQHPKLAGELRLFITALTQNTEDLPPKKISLIAGKTEAIAKAVLSGTLDNAQIDAYEQVLSKNLPKPKITYDSTKMTNALGTLLLCLLMGILLEKLTQGASSSSSFKSTYALAMLSNIIPPLSYVGLTGGVYLSAKSVFRKPNLIATAEKIKGSLRNIMTQEDRYKPGYVLS